MLGVSGGGDSMALLHLMHAAGHEVVAATVDHRLRAGSGNDAAFVARTCAELGVLHRIVRRPDGTDWRDQEAAREGRYDLLLAVARELDAPVVVAHTLDDQAETVRMRARRGGGTLGLSGIPPVATLAGETQLLRPLLDATRRELRLVPPPNGWIEDPSNLDTRFERIRVRRRDEAGARAVGRFAHAARQHRAAIMRAVAQDLQANWDGASYRPELEGIARVHAVRLLLRHVGGTRFLPSQERVAAFLASEPALTIGGAVVRKGREALVFSRDPRARHVPLVNALERFRPRSDDPVHAVLTNRQ